MGNSTASFQKAKSDPQEIEKRMSSGSRLRATAQMVFVHAGKSKMPGSSLRLDRGTAKSEVSASSPDGANSSQGRESGC